MARRSAGQRSPWLRAEQPTSTIRFGLSLPYVLQDGILVPGERMLRESPEFGAFFSEARRTMGTATGTQRIRMATKFVHDNIQFNEENQSSSVGSVIGAMKVGGMCYHQSLILAEILRAEGFAARAIIGRFENADVNHAWVLVDHQGKELLADPNKKRVGSYAKIEQEHGYTNRPLR